MDDVQIEELRRFVVELVAAEPDRLDSTGFWQEPLLVSAPIDERFEILPQIAFNEQRIILIGTPVGTGSMKIATH